MDAIWSKYASEDLIFNSGAAGIWKGRVEGGRSCFIIRRISQAMRPRRFPAGPTRRKFSKAKSVLAEDVQKISGQTLDLVVQAQFCAALNRHAIDLNAAAGTTQDWSDSTKFFKTEPYNAYVQFWHRADINWEQVLQFCYDDVFEYSSTINAPSATDAKVTIGGFYDGTSAIRPDRKVNGAGCLSAPGPATGCRYLRGARYFDIREGSRGNVRVLITRSRDAICAPGFYKSSRTYCPRA